jgi:methoxymalonate biosynthesis protein
MRRPGEADRPALVKCLVWDLDNTLWQGTLAEGDEIALSHRVAAVVTELDSRGILQSIASKNDYEPAWARLTELGVAKYFVRPKIGWGRKPDAMRQIADDLSFAVSTMAFIDDQPAERAEMLFHLPEVRCYPADQAASLAELSEFSPGKVTADARRRRQMYQARFRREAEQAAFTGPDQEFLRSLELVMRISRANADDLARVCELTLRTSQMNATGVYYSDAVLRGLLVDQEHEVLVITLTDRFGPHGAVGVVLLARHRAAWHLKLLATSCRVVSFGAGSVILNWLVDQAAQAGCHLVADFRPTARNRMMEVAYRFAGFGDDACACRADIAEVTDVDITRLHIAATRQPAPVSMRLITPDLAAARC